MPVTEYRLTATADTKRIVQGEALTLTVELFDEVSRQALPLDELDDASAQFAGTDATVTKELSDGVEVAADAGRLLVTLTAADTAALKLGDAQSWQVTVTIDDDVRIVQLLEQLDVVASLF